MCGIFSYYGKTYNWSDLSRSFDLISYRGPDNSHYKKVGEKIFFGFHRLAIMGISDTGDQPMKHPEDESLTLICNGEIYNYKSFGDYKSDGSYGRYSSRDEKMEFLHYYCHYIKYGM